MKKHQDYLFPLVELN